MPLHTFLQNWKYVPICTSQRCRSTQTVDWLMELNSTVSLSPDTLTTSTTPHKPTHTHTQTERDDFAEVSLSHNWSFSMHTLVFIIISTIFMILRIKPSVCATVPLRYTHIKHAILLNVLWNEKLHVCNKQIHQGIFYFIIHNNVSSSEKVNLLLCFHIKIHWHISLLIQTFWLLF